MTKAVIITIGDELLIGQVIDTNSSFIAQALNSIGIPVIRRVAVGDNYEDIWNCLDEAKLLANIVIITGGLGPTADDITKPLLCKYFGGKMIVHDETLQHIKNIFEKKLKRPMLESNLKQAEVPNVCAVLFNKNGTAPGMWFEQKGKIFVSLPGVPHEMKSLIQDKVLGELQKTFETETIEHRTLLTVGIGESYLAQEIKDFETNLPSNIKLAYLPNYGMVRLRLTAIGNNVLVEVNKEFEKLKLKVANHLAADYDATMEKIIFDLLKNNNKTLATAESCTGGYIAHLLTNISGASAVFKGSVIAYDNQVKIDELSINKFDIETEGAVSETVVKAMAQNVRIKMKTDFGIATSGILGPNGGTPTKPVGTIWIAVSDGFITKTKLLQLHFDRARNMQITANQSLNLLREMLINCK